MNKKNQARKTLSSLLDESNLQSRIEIAEGILKTLRQYGIDAFVADKNGDTRIVPFGEVGLSYTLMVENMNEGAVTLIPGDAIYYCNPCFEQTVQVPPGQVIGDSFHKFIAEEEQRALEAILKNVGKDGARGEFHLLTAKGVLIPVQLSVYRMDIENVKAISIIVTDITQRKRSEEELKSAYIKLKDTQNELLNSEKLAVIGRFSSGIAHELRNPLANISALAQIISSKQNPDKKLKKHLQFILENADIANKIIEDLLNFASPADYKLRPGRVSKILEGVCNIVQSRCAQKNVKLIKKIPGKFPRIMLNEKKLANAFLNFISNSIDSMPRGGTLKIAADFDDKKNKIFISFRDQGAGIPPESIDKIFEPFYTTKADGIGLGMSLAYKVIKSHNGELDITSKVNKGTEVLVSLPVMPANIEN